MIDFAHFKGDDAKHANAIVERAYRMFKEHGVKRDRLSIRMDLEATAAKIPLRLAELVEADDFNFAHDLGGIARHLNRQTGEMEDCFIPRFAAHEPAGSVA